MLILLLSWVLSPAVKLKNTSMAGLKPLYQVSVEDHLNERNELNNRSRKNQTARISIQLILDPSLIKIKNTGNTDAKNVRIIFDGIPIENYPGILINKNHNTISSQETIVIQACMGVGVFPSDFVEITWDDKEAVEKFYRISLYN